jgi:tRNA pseudouridine65 synthase
MLGVHRMLLHAWRLQFVHPLSGVMVSVDAPLDREYSKALDVLGIAAPC